MLSILINIQNIHTNKVKNSGYIKKQEQKELLNAVYETINMIFISLTVGRIST